MQIGSWARPPKLRNVCDFCPRRKAVSVRNWLTAIRQAHIPAVTVNKYTYFRRVLSGTHDVVLKLYETSLRTYSADKCKWEINALRKSEFNFFYVCTQVICLFWYVLSYRLQMACNTAV